tara:strand:+ start:1071 stop:2231 length:1161 start_codon:yes stop_codon:yes gene_type:complete
MGLPLLAAPYIAPAMISSGLLATAGTQYLSKPGVSQGIIDNFINNKGLLNLSTFTNPSLNIFRNVIDTPSGQVFAPDADDIEKQAEFNRELGKNITLPTDNKIEPLITTDGYKPSGLLSTPEVETIDSSNITKELPPSLLSDYIFTTNNLKTIYHGTDKDFDEFDVEQSSDGSIWFTDDKKAIEDREVGASGFGRIIERQIDEGKLKLATSDQKDKYLDDELIAQGYDGVKFSIEEGYDDNSYRIFFPEKLLDVSYRSESPSEDNARLDDLTQTFPNDIYSSNAIRYYGNPNNLADIESNEIIQKAKGNPNMEVTIYRAVPNINSANSINEGDFVTLSKTYAEDHAYTGYGSMGNESGKILTKKVKVKDLITGGNDLNEFGYYPKD